MRNASWLAAAFLIPALVGLAAPPAHGQPVIVAGPAPVVTYSYPTPPVVTAGPVAVTSYYRYGLLGRGVAVTRYAAPVVPYPGPAVTYYSPPAAVAYYPPRQVVTYYPAPPFCPW